MTTLHFLLPLTTLLVALVAGIVLTFAIVVMPGIRALGGRDSLRAFQAMDRIIQNNQPVFMVVWLGSALSLIATTAVGVSALSGVDRILIGAACLLYVGGVQVPTAVVNVPLNNQLQRVDLVSAPEQEIDSLVKAFDARWLRWNSIRTGISLVVSALLLTILARLG